MVRPYTVGKPFRFWCQKILPLVYDDSLSYYELLNKVVDYLNNVINNVNSIGEAFNELGGQFESLQSSFNELSKMVDNYFDNLDVQQEINNKLDAMAEDGTLDAIIQQALNNYLTPEMFGAKGDGETDDTLAIAATLTAANKRGLPIVGTGTYKATSVTINNDNTVMYLKRLVCSGDALVITSSYNSLAFERITSTGGCGVVFRNGKYTKCNANFINSSVDAVKLISADDSVMFNDISSIEVHGAVGIHIDYTGKTNASEWVNENIFHVWAFHAPIGIHINGATYARCNANIFYEPDFEHCSTAGVVIDGKTQYNRFVNCRNEEVVSDKILFQVNGSIRSSVIDCKMPAYATNFVISPSATGDNRNTPNIITNGLFTVDNIIMWSGQVAFTNNGSSPILYPLTIQKQTPLYIASNAVLNPRTHPALCRASALFGNGVRTLDISDDYGYNAGSLPDLIISRDDTLTLTKNGSNLATITNTDPNHYAVVKKVYFVDDSTVKVI